MTQTSDWLLVYDGFDPEQEGRREALCVAGQRRTSSRAARAEESQADGVHYPGTYVAGGYNRLVTEIGGRPIVNEDLVNFPNWLPLTFRPEGGAWFAPDAGELLAYRQVLDMREGVLIRELRVRDDAGRETRVRSRRIVHMEQPNLAAIEYSITPRTGPAASRCARCSTDRWSTPASRATGTSRRSTSRSWTRAARAAASGCSCAPCSRASRSAWRRARGPGAATRRSTRAAPRGGARARRHGAELRHRAGRDGRRREDGGALHVPRPGRSARRRLEAREALAHAGGSRSSCARTRSPGGRSGAAATSGSSRDRRRAAHPAPAHLPPAPDRQPALDRPRRRRPGAGLARGGLPRPHLLGRAVRVPVPQPPASG